MLQLPDEKKMWRRRSWTYFFNLIILGVAIWADIDSEVRNLLIIVALTNLGLREKTQRKIHG